MRRGFIRAALNTDLDAGDSTTIVMRIVGHNGQTPNMDVPNVVATRSGGIGMRLHKRAANSSGILWGLVPHASTLHSAAAPARNVETAKHTKAIERDNLERFQETAHFNAGQYASFLISLYEMTLGIPTGDHGPFLAHNIDALTVSSSLETSAQSQESNTEVKPVQMQTVAEIIGSSLRSLNNLLEELHHPPFLYIPVYSSRMWEFGSQLPFALPTSIMWAALVGQLWANYVATPVFLLPSTLKAMAAVILAAASVFGCPLFLHSLDFPVLDNELITSFVIAQSLGTIAALVVVVLPAILTTLPEKQPKNAVPKELEATWRSLRCHNLVLGSVGALTITAASFGLGTVLTMLLLLLCWFSRPYKAVSAMLPRKIALIYYIFSIFVLVAASPMALIGAVALAEQSTPHHVLAVLVDEFVVSSNLFWPSLCFLHFPIYAVSLHIVLM